MVDASKSGDEWAAGWAAAMAEIVDAGWTQETARRYLASVTVASGATFAGGYDAAVRHFAETGEVWSATGFYCSVLVPYSETPTEWHPTESTGPFATLTRGAFNSEEEAHAWARDHLAGNPYSVRLYPRG